MAITKLLSTDFDGTLIGFNSDGRCSPDFSKSLLRFHETGGLWAINTGRTLEHAIDGILRFQPPIAPDFLLTNEREVYRWDEGWAAYGEWNEQCTRRHEQLFAAAMDLFAEVERIARHRGGIRVIYQNDRPEGVVTESELHMDTFVRDLEDASLNHLAFGYQRNSIYLRFCHRDYHKGSALAELCRLENIPPAQVLAAGDHYNDIPMLDPRYAAMMACPVNAIDPVKEKVTLAGGFVSTHPCADGIADALKHYQDR